MNVRKSVVAIVGWSALGCSRSHPYKHAFLPYHPDARALVCSASMFLCPVVSFISAYIPHHRRHAPTGCMHLRRLPHSCSISPPSLPVCALLPVVRSFSHPIFNPPFLKCLPSLRQAPVQHQAVEDLHGLLQLSAGGGHRGRKNLLHARRPQPGAERHGPDQARAAPHGRTRHR